MAGGWASAFANAVVVSGAGTAAVNETYALAATVNERPSYEYSPGEEYRISWTGSEWLLERVDVPASLYATIAPHPSSPWQGTWGVVDGDAPAPTFSPVRA
jgi:hypothetical protein